MKNIQTKIFLVFVLILLPFVSVFGCSEPPVPAPPPTPPPPTVPPPEIVCPKQSVSTNNGTKSGGTRIIVPPTLPITTDLSLSTLPRLGETAELTCRVTAHGAEWPIEVNIYFSKGISFVDGYRSWDGNIPKDCSLVLKCLIKPVEMGDWYFGVKAVKVISRNTVVGDITCKLLQVTEKGTSIQWADCDPSKIDFQK